MFFPANIMTKCNTTKATNMHL